jgi:predicted site-specific integrase-resolvase
MTTRRLLKKLGYSLKANRKELSNASHPDRDRQFRYLERVKQLFLAHGHPVISVDSKKKEPIGDSVDRIFTVREPPKQ